MSFVKHMDNAQRFFCSSRFMSASRASQGRSILVGASDFILRLRFMRLTQQAELMCFLQASRNFAVVCFLGCVDDLTSFLEDGHMVLITLSS